MKFGLIMDVIFENLLMFYNNFARSNTMAVIKLSCFVSLYNKRLETISLFSYTSMSIYLYIFYFNAL